MTKQEALKQTIEIWSLLAKYNCTKREAIDKLGFNLAMTSYCPCCEYAFRVLKGTCKDCPIKWVESSEMIPKCVHLNSPYQHWRIAMYARDKKRYAKQVVKLAQEALDKLQTYETLLSIITNHDMVSFFKLHPSWITLSGEFYFN